MFPGTKGPAIVVFLGKAGSARTRSKVNAADVLVQCLAPSESSRRGFALSGPQSESNRCVKAADVVLLCLARSESSRRGVALSGPERESSRCGLAVFDPQ